MSLTLFEGAVERLTQRNIKVTNNTDPKLFWEEGGDCAMGSLAVTRIVNEGGGTGRILLYERGPELSFHCDAALFIPDAKRPLLKLAGIWFNGVVTETAFVDQTIALELADPSNEIVHAHFDTNSMELGAPPVGEQAIVISSKQPELFFKKLNQAFDNDNPWGSAVVAADTYMAAVNATMTTEPGV